MAEAFVLRFGSRLKAIVQYMIPVAVAVDTARSFYYVQKLAVERLQEMQEEDNEQMVADTTALLKRVVTHCATKDIDFWPPALAPLAGIAAATNTAELDAPATNTTGPAATLLDELLLTTTTTSIHQPTQNQEPAAHTEPTTQHQQIPPTRKHQLRVIYVTMDDVWNYLSQTMQLMASSSPADTSSSTNSTSTARSRSAEHVIQVHHEFGLAIDKEMRHAADTVREYCTSVLPCWPQLTMTRKSALRYNVGWHGLAWIDNKPPLERILVDDSASTLEHKQFSGQLSF